MPNPTPNFDRPGWRIIYHYMPEATPEEQEKAYERLRQLAQLAIRAHIRPADE